MEFIRNLRIAARSLARTPGYAVAFVLTLGLGIGVNTAIFSVVNGVLLRPLPYPDADRILFVRQPAGLVGVRDASFSFHEIDDYRAQARTVDEIVEFGDWTFSVVGLGDPHRAVGGLVTSNYFEVLDLQAALGRTLQEQDDEQSSAPVMVLTHDYWTRAFGADPDVLGRTVKLTGKTVEVVGVLEPGTHYTGSRQQNFFVNYTTNDHYMGAAMRDARTHRMTNIFARLRPDQTVEAAQAEFEEIGQRVRGEYPEAYPERAGFGIGVDRWQDELTRQARPTFLILMGTVAMVLLLACANVANLTLSRLIRRQREFAVRAALGAGTSRLRNQMLAENLILALLGAGVGLVLSAAGIQLLVDYAGRFTVRTGEIGLDPWVLGFTVVLAVGIAVVLAWLPGLGFTKRLNEALSAAGGGGRNSGGLTKKRLQRTLVVGQLALSFTLLIGAALMVRSLLALQNEDTGFDAEDVLVLETPNMGIGQRTAEEERVFFDGVVGELRSFPGVVHAAHASSAPLTNPMIMPRTFQVLGEDEPVASTPMGIFNIVSPMYFETLGVPIVRGRAFSMNDEWVDSTGVQSVIINQAMADAYFPGESPIGQQIRSQNFSGSWGQWAEIVGVAANSRDAGLAQDGVHTVYVPSAQFFPGDHVLIRTRGDVAPLVQQAREVIWSRAPERPIDGIATLGELIREDIAPQRLNATLFMSFAVLALLIAAVGVLGVLGFSVSQRTNEFGIRMALGARQENVLQMVLREGALLAVGALALGAVGAWYLSRFIADLLYQVEPFDPTTYVAVGGVLAVVAILASYVPARRATRVDPMVALRNE